MNIKRDIKRNIKAFLAKHPKYEERVYEIFDVRSKAISKAEVVVYFFGGMGQTYQIKQWIDTFKELNKIHKIVVVVRNREVQSYFKTILPFPIAYRDSVEQLHKFYNKHNFKVIIYINNGVKNFQSLLNENVLHIHINHGESDKSSDHSNQVKGYDYIFVHAPNGYNNYMKYLINLDHKKLIQTGRPQLDFINPIRLDTKNRPVVIYTTTYEATHRSMRYTSVDVYGEKIVNQIIDSNRYFFIYKPHPNLGGNDPKVEEIHQKIIKKVESSPYAVMLDKEDVNNIFPIVDFGIFDMSSTMTDFLNVNRPFLLADVFNPEVHNVEEYNILKGCNRLNQDNIDNLIELIEDEIKNDPMREKREEVKKLYLGDYKKGESIKKFISSITDIINERDRLISKKIDPFTNKIKKREININRSRAENGYENIAIYFFGEVSAIYQIEQFREVFEAIDKREKLRFVVRDLKVYRYLKAETAFNIAYAYTIDDVLTYYEDNDFKVILYINDGYKNFQSLIYHRALHIYLDFGDNDNYIEHSSQSKGFDYIYFKDNKVLEVYRDNLIKMPEENYRAIGDILTDKKSVELLIDNIFKAMNKRDRLLEDKNMLNTIH